jgi:hypothetical protein
VEYKFIVLRKLYFYVPKIDILSKALVRLWLYDTKAVLEVINDTDSNIGDCQLLIIKEMIKFS